MVSSLNESYDNELFFSQASQPAQLQLLSYDNGKTCLKICVIQPSHHTAVSPYRRYSTGHTFPSQHTVRATCGQHAHSSPRPEGQRSSIDQRPSIRSNILYYKSATLKA